MEQTLIYLLIVQKSIASPLCLENISKDFSVDNMKKTGLNGYVYDFSVDYMLLQLVTYWTYTSI